MPPTDTPRLIEVAFPLHQASIASVHEKNVRHGHISTLHIWPARRPLAACRAALLATLLPDPGDPTRRAELLREIGGDVIIKHVTETSPDGRAVSEEKKTLSGGVLAWGNEGDAAMDKFRAAIRAGFPDGAPRVLDPFAGGGAIPLEAMRLGCRVTAGDLNPVAWFILKCTLDYPQRFAGKRWPLPPFTHQWADFITDFLAGKIKKRKGTARVYFTNDRQMHLDPAKISGEPAMSSRVAETPGDSYNGALHDASLAWHVRAWGRWVLERARTELAARYPEHDGEPTVAYLHARTARDKISLARIPLLKTFWLCKKAGRRVALLPVPLADRSGVEFRLLGERELADPERIIYEYPHLHGWEVSAASFPTFLARGTMNKAGVWCPASGRPGMVALTMDDLRRQGQQGLLETQMTAVVVEQSLGKKTRKRYRLPTTDELRAAVVEQEDLEDLFREIPFGIPGEPLPPIGTLGFRIPLYGFKQWRDLFTPRQLLALGVFVKHTRCAIIELQKLFPGQPEIAEVIGAYLATTLNRVADRSSVICSWTIGHDQVRNTFARFALGMTWDFCEVNPLMQTSGGFPGQLELIAEYCEHAVANFPSVQTPTIAKRSATGTQPGSNALVLTDPPYYDAIPYSDLMDFFYVWLRRTLSGHHIPAFDENFCSELAPKWNHEQKDGELIDDESRFGGDRKASKEAYEEGMAESFRASLTSLTADGRLVVVFANKEVAAWETLIGALIKGGAVVTASWPMQTERAARTRNIASAALSTSVWIVCRKRPDNAAPGWDKGVLDRMHDILFSPRTTLGHRNILQYYFDLGIRGPDFLWAALGPALEAYSAHPFVKKQGGGTMGVTEFLRHVRRLVLQFSLGELPGFREISRDIQGRGELLDLDPITQYYLLHRAFFGLADAPAGACILYANGCGLNESALKLVWQILEQGGKSVERSASWRNVVAEAAADEEDADEEEEATNSSKGNEYRLVDWRARGKRDGLGEGRAGQPSPLIDRLHRLMFLLAANRAGEVQETYENWGLASDRAFLPLIQALHGLADRDRRPEEKKMVEALASQLKLHRRMVEQEGVVREEQTLIGWGKQKVEA